MLKLSEKHTKIVQDFVDTFSLDRWFPQSTDEKFVALTELFDSLHGKFIDKYSARHILIAELARFRFEDKNHNGSPADKETSHLYSELLARLTECIESFPRNYFFNLELPSFSNIGDFEIKVSNNIRLVSGNKTISPPKSGIQALVSALEVHAQNEKRSTYFQFQMSGYGNSSAESPVSSEAISIAKQCAFVLITHGTFDRSFDEQESRALLETERPSIFEEVLIPGSLSRCFGSLVINGEKLLVPDSGKIGSILSPSMRMAETNEEKTQALSGTLNCLSKYFSYQNHVDFQSISAAIEWYQDSLFSDNQTLAFLSACIGLEALLGDENQMENMTNRLSDRYGFLMGKGRTSREKLRQDYKSVLVERGKLVHARKARLSGQTANLLQIAQKMLLDVIWHELHQMYRNR